MTAHKRAIGGSDLGACIGLYRPDLAEEVSPFQTAADVWMRLVHDIEKPRTAAMQRGLDAEPRLRRMYLETYGGAYEHHERPWIERHPQLPFASVSPDDVWLGSSERIYVEWKTASIFSLYPKEGQPPTKWGEPDSEDIPEGYRLQVQLNLEILDLPLAHLVVGFGKDAKSETGQSAYYYSETRRYFVQRDPELLSMALTYAERFYREFICTRKPPSVAPKKNKREWSRLLKEQSWKTTEATVAPSP